MALEDPPRRELKSVSCMALESLKAKLASLPGGSSPVSNEKPVSPIQSGFRPSFNSPLPSFNTANSTSPFPTGPSTIDTAKATLKLLNPLNEATVRPLFAKPGEEVTTNFGGLPFTITHDIVARTIEAIPNIAITTVANFRGGSVKTPFDVSRLGITDSPGQQFVQTTGDKMISKFDKLQAENPDSTGKNIALASLSPMEDALNAFILGDMLTSVARYGLKATKYSPKLNKALQIYGLEGKTGDELSAEFVKQFNKKARTLTEAEDITGLNQLGEATNTIVTHMTGKGIPTLNRLGKMVQDLSRLGLQDAKGGLKLKNPLYAEIAPGKAPQALPGYVVEPGQAPAFGMSIQRVNKVGGESPSEGPFYRSKEGGKAFEEVKDQDVMPAIIKKDLDTFVVKDAEGYTVIEGKSGQALGETAKTLTEAIDSAKTQISQLGDKLDEFISGSKLSPRYTQVAKETAQDMNKVSESFKNKLISEAKSYGYGIKFIDRKPSGFYGKHFSDKKVIEIYTKKKDGTPRTQEDIERTISHELGHIEDYDRRGITADPMGDLIRGYDGKPRPAADQDIYFRDNRADEAKRIREIYKGQNTQKEVYADAAVLYRKDPEKLKDIAPRIHAELAEYYGKRKAPEKEVAKKETTAPLNYRGRNIKIQEKVVRAKPDKLIKLAQTSGSYDDFLDRSGITEEALDMTAKKQGFDDAREYYLDARKKMEMSPEEAKQFDSPSVEQPRSEDEALELLAEQEAGSEFALSASVEEEAKIVQNLERVFADMKGVDVSDLKMKFTEEDLYMAELNYKFALDGLLDHPGRALVRFISKKEGDFLDFKDPAKAKTSSERARIEERNDRVTKAAEVAFEGTKWSDVFDDPDTIREVIEEYVTRRDSIKALAEELKSIRADIRLSKQADKFIGKESKKLASQLAGNLEAMQRLVQAAERAGFRRGMEKGGQKYQDLVARLKDRRGRINVLKEVYNLTDGEMTKVRGNEDPRFMERDEFETYLEAIEKKAEDIQSKNRERTIINAIIKEKDLKNTENLREAMQLPTLEKMNLDQLQLYSTILNKFKEGDEFLSKRTLEVIDRTALKGARTTRQVRTFLAQEIKRTTGKEVNQMDLDNLTAGAFDYLRYDTALAESKPFFGFMVNRVQTHIMGGEANFLRLQDRVDELAKRANDSRRRTLGQKIKRAFIPTNRDIIRYLEARGTEKEMYGKALTPDEKVYADFIRNYYNNAYNYLSYINELHGSRYIDAYFTHIKKGFLEKWSDDGFVDAIRNLWVAQKEDMAVANIIDSNTGQILPKSKFFQFVLKRTGEGEVSQNVTRVFLQYAKLFERKRMLDKMIPELDIYTNSLAPKELTPRGLEMNRTFKEFVNNYLNTKRGRKFNFGGIIKQNGPMDIALRIGNTAVSLRDLGWNIGSAMVNMVGEQFANYQMLGVKGEFLGWKRRLWDTGLKRLKDPAYAGILKQAEPFTGRNMWTELMEVDKPVGERAMTALFGALSQGSVEANKIFLLANLTKQELKAGKISAERMAQLRLEAGRYRDMGRDVKSIVGSTSAGGTGTKYKGWAIPILRTNIKNILEIASMLKKGNLKGAAKAKQTHELIRAIQATAAVIFVGSAIMSEEKDDSFLGRLKAGLYKNALTILGGTDPTLFVSTPRLYSFIQDFVKNIKSIVLLEEYQQDGKYGDKGDLKGIGGLKQQFTPAFLRQFIPAPEAAPKSSGRTRGSQGRSSREREARKPRTRRQRERTRG